MDDERFSDYQRELELELASSFQFSSPIQSDSSDIDEDLYKTFETSLKVGRSSSPNLFQKALNDLELQQIDKKLSASNSSVSSQSSELPPHLKVMPKLALKKVQEYLKAIDVENQQNKLYNCSEEDTSNEKIFEYGDQPIDDSLDSEIFNISFHNAINNYYGETSKPDKIHDAIEQEEIVKIFESGLHEYIDKNTILLHQIIPADGSFKFYFAEIDSPIHFWFHRTDKLNELQNALQKVYGKLKDNQMTLQNDDIEVGTFVACYLSTFDAWYRAKIVSLDKGNIRVFLFDWGTSATVDKSVLKPLMIKFAEKVYGHRGRIPKLMPPNSNIAWSLKDLEIFIEKCSGGPMKARVLRYDEEERCYELEILLQIDGQNVSVRDWLLERNLARECEESEVKPFCYHFPNFDSLEKDFLRYSTRTILEGEPKGMHFETLIEINFFERVDHEVMNNNRHILGMFGKLPKVRKFYFQHQED